MPIAIACLRLFTLRRPPDFSLPCLYSCIALPTFFLALEPYLRRPELLELLDEELDRLDFFFALEREVPRCDDLLPLLWLAEVRRRLPLLLRLELPRRVEPDFFAVAIKDLASSLCETRKHAKLVVP